MTKICQHCGIPFTADKKERKYCSLACAYVLREMPHKVAPRPWVPCSICLAKTGLGNKKVSKLIPVATPMTVWFEWKRAGFDFKSITKVRRPKKEKIIKPKVERGPRMTAMEHYYANHEKMKERGKERAKRYYHARIKVDPDYTLRHAIRNNIHRMIRYSGQHKSRRSENYLGCTYAEARQHIEKQFKRGMSWANHGDAWEIDHIMPLSAFNLTDPNHLSQASHYTNLRPLWKQANRIKGDTIHDHQAQLL